MFQETPVSCCFSAIIHKELRICNILQRNAHDVSRSRIVKLETS